MKTLALTKAGEKPSSVSRLRRVAMVVADRDAAERFFTEAFDFVVTERRTEDASFSALLGVSAGQIQQTFLRLGEQDIALMQFDPPGRSYPPGSTSTDLWFQHFAIIVSDMEAAFARLNKAGQFTPISENGPQQLPPGSGSVQAFKFRGAEGHPLELLAFPEGSGPQYWQAKAASALFLGIDHSAIAVADTARSLSFYEGCLGLVRGEQTENKGPEQAAMDAVPGAAVTVTGLNPSGFATPHVELLGYHVGSRMPIARDTRSDDIAATQFVLETTDLQGIVDALTRADARFVSPGIVTLTGGGKGIMVLDPDGHRICIVQTRIEE